jgi:hypothetical protein
LSGLIELEAVAGSNAFFRRFEPNTVAARHDREYPGRHRHAGRPPLEVLVGRWANRRELGAAVRVARDRHGYTQAEISIATRLSVSTVGRILRRSRAGESRVESGEEIDDL